MKPHPATASGIAALLLTAAAIAQKPSAPSTAIDAVTERIANADLLGDLDAVRKLVTEWRSLEPDSAAPWLRLQAALSMGGEGEAALDSLRDGVSTLPQNATLKARLAGSLWQSEKPVEAIRILRGLYEAARDPLERISWAVEMHSSLTKHQVDPSIYKALPAYFESQWQNDAKEPLPLLARAEQCFAGPEMGPVLRAREIAPEDPVVWLQQGRALHSIGRPLEALPWLRKAHEKLASPASGLQLARACIYAGDHEEALRLIRTIGRDPKTPTPYVETAAVLCLEEAAWEEAISIVRPRLESEPENYRLLFVLGSAMEELGQIEEAQAAFLQLIGIKRDVVASGAPPLALISFEPKREEKIPFYAPFALELPLMKNLPGEARRLSFWMRAGIGNMSWHSYGYVRRDEAKYGFVAYPLVSRYDGESILPGSLEEAMGYSIPHLTAIWTKLPPKQRTELEVAAWKRGMPGKSLFPFYHPGRIEGESGPGQSRLPLKCDPMTPAATVAAKAFELRGGIPALRVAWQHFKKDRPDLSLLALSKLGDDPKSRAAFEEATATGAFKSLATAEDQAPKDDNIPEVLFTDRPGDAKAPPMAFQEHAGAKNEESPPSLDAIGDLIRAERFDNAVEALAQLIQQEGVKSAVQRDLNFDEALDNLLAEPLRHPQVGPGVIERLEALPTASPRAVLEKAHTLLFAARALAIQPGNLWPDGAALAGDPTKAAYDIFKEAIKRDPASQTLPRVALEYFNAIPDGQHWLTVILAEFGFRPFMNRTELYDLPFEDPLTSATVGMYRSMRKFLEELSPLEQKELELDWLDQIHEEIPPLIEVTDQSLIESQNALILSLRKEIQAIKALRRKLRPAR